MSRIMARPIGTMNDASEMEGSCRLGAGTGLEDISPVKLLYRKKPTVDNSTPSQAGLAPQGIPKSPSTFTLSFRLRLITMLTVFGVGKGVMKTGSGPAPSGMIEP